MVPAIIADIFVQMRAKPGGRVGRGFHQKTSWSRSAREGLWWRIYFQKDSAGEGFTAGMENCCSWMVLTSARQLPSPVSPIKCWRGKPFFEAPYNKARTDKMLLSSPLCAVCAERAVQSKTKAGRSLNAGPGALARPRSWKGACDWTVTGNDLISWIR